MTGRPQTVLVPTDFSHDAKLALERALLLPLASDAKVVVLHVLPGELTGEVRQEAEASTQAELAKLMASVPRRPGVDLVAEISSGAPFEQIIARARALDAGLIVMGRHGRRAIRDLFIGSTADRTIRYGDVPVLVVHIRSEGPYRHPLIAIDLDETSLRVAELAASVLDPEVEIGIIHAYRIPFEGLHAARGSHFERELQARAEEAMDKLLTSLGEDRARWKPVITRGEARSTILGEILTRGTDLVVLGTHGRSGLAHTVVGSVAEWVIAAARCDVLVTRPARFTFAMP